MTGTLELAELHGLPGTSEGPLNPTPELLSVALTQSFPTPIFYPALTLIMWMVSWWWRRQWHPTPVLLPGKSHGWRSLEGCSPWGRWRSDMTERLHFHALEKEMATHSSVLAWRIPGMGEPGGLPSMGSHRVGHDWSDLAHLDSNSLMNWIDRNTLMHLSTVILYFI